MIPPSPRGPVGRTPSSRGPAGPVAISLLTLLFAAGAQAQGDRMPAPNTLTPAEEKAGWRLLFDGATTRGWRAYAGDSMPAGWQVRREIATGPAGPRDDGVRPTGPRGDGGIISHAPSAAVLAGQVLVGFRRIG